MAGSRGPDQYHRRYLRKHSEGGCSMSVMAPFLIRYVSLCADSLAQISLVSMLNRFLSDIEEVPTESLFLG